MDTHKQKETPLRKPTGKAMYLLRKQIRLTTFPRRFIPFSTSTFTEGGKKERLFPEELNIIYDSKCNVCKLEIDFLTARDSKLASGSKTIRKLKMTDLESDDYNPEDPANGGVQYEQGMRKIHAVTADGRVIHGVPVFSSAYELVQLGWIFRFTEWPIFKGLVGWGYDFFAQYRTNITRGSSIEDLVEAYEAKKALQEAQEQDCASCDNNVKNTN